MLNVSSAFKQMLYEDKRDYLSYADITLSDGTVLNLDNSGIWNDGMEISDSVSSDNSFDVGAAIVNSAKIVINNIYDDYSDYDFSNAQVIMYVGMKLPDGTIERIRKGTFHVDEAKYNGAIITLNCLDNISKFDSPYSESTLKYPATLGQIVRDACLKCGVTLQTYNFPHDDYVVKERPDDEATTFGEVIQWAAQIACCFCRCDVYGRLELKWYDQEAFENRYFLSGGTFKNIPPTNETVSGGTFNPWTDGETINSGEFSELNGIHHIYSLSSISTSTDDVVITGISVTVKASDDDSEQEIVVSETGTLGYVISFENNDLINIGDGPTIAGWIGEKLIGFRFRKASISHLSDPTIEAGDVAILTDTKGRNYNIIISSTKFNSNGSYQNTESSALDPIRNSAIRFSEATKNYVDYRKEIKREKTAREQAIENLTNRINNSSGVFTTVDTQPDGSNIYYLHNKPSLSDSDIIWKMTAEAWGVSTNGGKSFNAGMTVDGDTIVRILTATGVNADWINTGAIQVKDDDGNIIFSVDMDTKQVIISGDYVRIGGKTASTAINDALQESKDYSDGKLADFADTITGDLSGLQAQIDGQIETFYKDYEPSLQNYPASEWTTTEERKKHEGDLFYWKSKGYTYRFFQDGATWKWQLVQDTDITQAMAAAEKAQDTADGKRRVFVVTPKPPYDIGDLWTNGTDILTCSTARPSGSVYVSTDWKKLNTYTDDTVANEALEEAKKARNLNMILDNEYQGIYTDPDGNIGTFPSVKTTAQVLYGHTDVSVDCSYATNKSSGVTGNWNNALRTYTVTGLSTDTGWVDITASYLSLFTVTKRFNIEKIKGGTNGKNGVSVTGTTTTYQSSSSGTDIPTGTWNSSVPTVSAGQYLWTRTQFNYSDGSHTYSYSVSRMGQNGTNGETGKGIKSVTNHYLATSSSSGVTTSTSGWTTTVQTITSSKKYLWNYETLTYTDNSTTNTAPCIIGTYGDKGLTGDDGNGISSITEHYAVSSSNTVTPATWSDTVPAMTVVNKYLWNYETIKYTNGTSTDTQKRVIGVYGDTGKNGADGKGIKSTEITYQASNSGTAIPTGEWSSSVPAVSAGQYLWTRTVTTYTDSTTTTSYSVGRNGSNGAPGRTYMIEPSVNILKRSKDNSISPNFVEFKSYYRDGNSATRTAYSGRWIIEETSDGDEWTTIYTSSANESSVTHYLYSMLADSDGSAIANSNGDTIGIPRDVVAIRAKLYASGGTTNLLDMQSIAVVVDVEALTHEEIFNLLTNNGEVKGIYQEGNQLYISFTYAKGGELTLGGSGNGNGKLKILNASGTQIGYIDNTGVHFNQGTFSGSLSAATGTFAGALQAATGSFNGTVSVGGEDNDGEILIYNSSGTLIGRWSSNGLMSGNYFAINDVGKTYASVFHCTRLCLAPTPTNDILDVNTVKSNYSTAISMGAYASGAGISGNALTIGSARSGDPKEIYNITIGKNNVTNLIRLYGSTTINGDLRVTGEKNRIVNTEWYGKRLMYSYEMTSPIFGDIGTAETDENGECIIYIDDIFYETINSGIEYHVFLQKEGEGDVWVDSKQQTYFSVRGTSNLKFSWEIKVKQREYEYNRLESDIQRDRAIGVENLLPTNITNKLEELLYETN